jgi:hypothetical protein
MKILYNTLPSSAKHHLSSHLATYIEWKYKKGLFTKQRFEMEILTILFYDNRQCYANMNFLKRH